MTVLDPRPTTTEPNVDLDFAARAAVYLRNEGLDRRAVALALQTELGVSAPDAIRLAATDPPTTH